MMNPEKPLIPLPTLEKLSTHGDYLYMGRPKTICLLRADTEGKLRFDPHQTGQTDIVNVMTGTSFATPRATARYLNSLSQ